MSNQMKGLMQQIEQYKNLVVGLRASIDANKDSAAFKSSFKINELQEPLSAQ